jgi:UDP-N-acetylglucosamine diphosphorylase/glucosamine-1-phosphate N-acetyltransferase
VGELRVGILTIKEKWRHHLKVDNISYITQDYLVDKFPIQIEEDNIVINGSVLPSPELVQLIQELSPNEALLKDGELIATRLDENQFEHLINNEEIEELGGFDVVNTPFLKINNLWDIFKINGEAIQEDYDLLTKNKISAPISSSNRVIAPENIFVEEGAIIECAILNATEGPIFIGKNALVMEGAMIRGAFALCDHSVVKMGAKVYGPTTVGPHSKIGGEVVNSVIMGYSNKGHEGYMGNSVLGEWCNLGADTNTSNLRNNYSNVKIWDYPSERFVPTGIKFCGLIMADHSKAGINTMFNTGTVVGVSTNVFGAGYPRNFIPSFSWGGSKGLRTYKTDKAFDTAEKVMARRKIEFDEIERKILKKVFELTSGNRSWESSK